MTSSLKTHRALERTCHMSNIDDLCVDVIAVITAKLSMSDLASFYMACEGNSSLTEKIDQVIELYEINSK